MDSELAKVQAFQAASGTRSYLFWGPPGTGKTLLATAHPGKRKLWIDADEKLGEMIDMIPTGIRNGITVWKPGVALSQQIELLTVDQTGKNANLNFDPKQPRPEGYDRQRKITNELLGIKARGEPFPYDLVVWDSMTRTSSHLVALTMWEHKVTSMTEKLWGVVGTNLLNYVLGFLQLPCDRIVIAHEQHKKMYAKDRETVLQEFIRPMVTGQMAQYLPQHFSEVYYFLGRSPSDKKYYIQTGSDQLKTARTAKPKLAFENPIDAQVIYG